MYIIIMGNLRFLKLFFFEKIPRLKFIIETEGRTPGWLDILTLIPIYTHMNISYEQKIVGKCYEKRNEEIDTALTDLLFHLQSDAHGEKSCGQSFHDDTRKTRNWALDTLASLERNTVHEWKCSTSHMAKLILKTTTELFVIRSQMSCVCVSKLYN